LKLSEETKKDIAEARPKAKKGKLHNLEDMKKKLNLNVWTQICK